MNSTQPKEKRALGLVGGHKSPMEQFKSRQSEELVIAFSGPIGCGIRSVIDATELALKNTGYEVVKIKLSKFIEDALKKGIVTLEKQQDENRAGRYNRLQTAGNRLREKYSAGDILSQYAVREIAVHRTERVPDTLDVDAQVPPRRAYIVDQLKHPHEVRLLRTVYRNLFYLIGVLSVFEKREKRLVDGEGLNPKEAISVIERDRKEPDTFGQQLDKTLQLADFFIRNDKPNVEQLGVQIRRFVGLMHGENGITPTRHEYGMYVAYSAGLSSACLSRQVGAALIDSEGNVASSGRNDVPKFGGGLYTTECGESDARCVKLEGRRCQNDVRKGLLLEQIKSVAGASLRKKWSELTQRIANEIDESLRAKGVQIPQNASGAIADVLKGKRFDDEDIRELTQEISEVTGVKDLTEYSRSIHAEMDALLSLARQGGGRPSECTMYVTTLPCHNCARHVVAAGIRTVYYIEPYEKSLAAHLHGDAINLDPDESSHHQENKKKVDFLHFEGVAPRQYINMFTARGERKENGVAVVVYASEARKAVPEYLDDYRAFEKKVVQNLSVLEGAK